VAVPAGTIALAVAAYFLYRAAKRAKSKAEHHEGGGDADAKEQATGGDVPVEMTQEGPGGPHQEVSSDQIPRQEMAASSDQVPRPEMATDSMKESVVLEKDGRPVLAEMDASGNATNRWKPE
jgi:hypothetical protein